MTRTLDISECLDGRVPSKRRPEHSEQRGVFCGFQLLGEPTGKDDDVGADAAF